MRDRIAGLSIPKAGTHLLAGVFKQLGYAARPCPKGRGVQILQGVSLGDPGRLYVYGHWRYSPQTRAILDNHGFAVALMLRDPRDICLSLADYLKAGRLSAVRPDMPDVTQLPLRRLQIMAITGGSLGGYPIAPARKTAEGWLPWLDHGAALLRYEDLGRLAAGAGSPPALDGYGIAPEALAAAVRRRFRVGGRAPGEARWPREFDDELRALWTKHAKGVAASLGYAED